MRLCNMRCCGFVLYVCFSSGYYGGVRCCYVFGGWVVGLSYVLYDREIFRLTNCATFCLGVCGKE